VLRAATATRRDVNVMMVLDRSGSMEQAHAIDDLQDAAGKFVNKFAAGRDKVGMLTFGGASYLPYRLSVNFKTGSPNIPDMIRNIEGGGATNTSQALWLAYNELQAQDEPGALNVIVLFTDGQPTAFTANFQPYLAGTSSCQNKNTPKLGFLTFSTSGASSSLGILYPTRNTFEADDELQRFADNSQNCAYTGDPRRVTLDVSRMPPNDSYGNLTSGYAGTPTSISPTHVEMASINATDNSARRIRTDDRLRPVIFVIGLGGANPPDKELMKRLANDPAASNYDRSQSAGLFVWSPSAAQLQDAFLRIASEILRLSI
jgi:hypothetical protein